jgi:hypothetical protein
MIKNDQLEERFLKTWQLLFALIRASSHYENVSTFRANKNRLNLPLRN